MRQTHLRFASPLTMIPLFQATAFVPISQLSGLLIAIMLGFFDSRMDACLNLSVRLLPWEVGLGTGAGGCRM